MKYFGLSTLLFAAGTLIAAGCGDSDSGSDAPNAARGGSSSGGSGGSSSSKGGASNLGSAGNSSKGGAAGEGTDTGEAGSEASAGTGAGGEGGSGPCANDARRCDGEQPQECSAGQWQDDGEPCVSPLSCNDGAGTCGTTSLAVPGGDFLRSDTDPATVSSFRLDKYEVTVGEFRGFAAAVVAGYRPDAGSGTHSYLNAGMGLLNTGAGGGYEAGWDSDWDAELLDSADGWDTALACNSPSSWTPEAGENESLPLNCASWYQAYAYCIWTGGFLPSEAEWNYAAAGGDEQRPYPWGSEEADATRVVFGVYVPEAVGSRPAGDGRWGHADLAGNLAEWTLDSFADYETPCLDCATLDDSEDRLVRGGNYLNNSSALFRTAHRGYAEPSGFVGFGFRCARAP